MEEALWSLEDKWKVSTHKAVALFACSSLLVIGVCVAMAASRWRRSGSVHQQPPPPRPMVVKALMGSVRWSKWEDQELRGKWDDAGGQSRNSSSGVWQRPILMGEKCELPRFSGLIMYDHKGMPLHQYEDGVGHKQQEMSPPVVTTTLRELL
ncbi:hypothetical protein ACS0TY_018339 [Phlomoides rotata]